MRKVKLVVHECYAGKRKSEEVFAALFYLRCHWQPHQLLQRHPLELYLGHMITLVKRLKLNITIFMLIKRPDSLPFFKKAPEIWS